MPLAGALDINYTCWNSHPTFVFKCVLSIITVRSEAKEQKLRIESRKWSTGAARTREKGVVGVSLACVPQLITCTKREARHVIAYSDLGMPCWSRGDGLETERLKLECAFSSSEMKHVPLHLEIKYVHFFT